MRLNLNSLYMEQDGPPLPQSAPPVMQCDFRYESDGVLDGYVEAHKQRLVRSTEMLQLHTLVQSLSEDLNFRNEENRKLCEVSQQLQEETMKWKKEAMRFRTYLQAILHVGVSFHVGETSRIMRVPPRGFPKSEGTLLLFQPHLPPGPHPTSTFFSPPLDFFPPFPAP